MMRAYGERCFQEVGTGPRLGRNNFYGVVDTHPTEGRVFVVGFCGQKIGPHAGVRDTDVSADPGAATVA